MSPSWLGFPAWAWLVAALAIVAGAWWWRGHAAKTARLAETESLAQQVDAGHEGAQTRHEGGA